MSELNEVALDHALTAEEVYLSEKVTVIEAAEQLHVSRDTVHNWIRQGDVFPNAHKIGPGIRSRWAIPKSDLVAFMVRQTGLPSGVGEEE